MTHKVHPFVFRIGQVTDWKSRWFSNKQYKQYLAADLRIRDFVFKKFGRLTITNVDIERSPNALKIIITTPRPGLIIGRGGGGVESLKSEIERKILKVGPGIKKKDAELKIEIQELRNSETSAEFVAASIAEQIEKRISTKRAMKQVMERVKANKNVQGVKIKVSGRIDGNTIARRETMAWGKIPLQTIRADIDYTSAMAHCTYGVVGIKVWIYRGEKFEK